MPHENQRRPASEWALALSLLALHVALAWLARQPGVRTGEDEALYALLADQLRQARYVDAHLVGTPAHTVYPPGYPGLLAVWQLAGPSFDWLLVLSVLSSVAALLLTFVIVRRRWGSLLGLLTLAALAVNPFLVLKAGQAYSEAPFLALSMTALWATTLDDARGRWIAGSAAIAAALTRSVGLALLPAVGILWLVQRRKRPVVVLSLAAILTVGAWQWHSFAAPEHFVGQSYAADFLAAEHAHRAEPAPRPLSLGVRLLERVRRNAWVHGTQSIPDRLPLPIIPGTLADNLAGLVLVLGGLAVGTVSLTRAWPAATLYLVCYGAILAVWPWGISRFVEPVIPLLVVTVLLGWRSLAAFIRPAWQVPVTVAIALLLVFTGALRTAPEIVRASACERGQVPPHASCLGPERDGYLRAALFLRDSVSRGGVVLSAKPATVYYYSGHQGISRPVGHLPDAEAFLPLLREEGVKYVLLGSVHAADPGQLALLMEATCDRVALRKAFPPFTYVFALDTTAGAAGDPCAAVRAFRRANLTQQFQFTP